MNTRLSPRLCMVLLLFVFLLAMPFAVFAWAPGEGGAGLQQGDSWDSGLASIYNILSGTTARIIGFIMIVVAGVLIMVTEGQAIKRIFWIILGVGVIVNVPGVFNMLFPNQTTGGFEIPVLREHLWHLSVILSQL